MPSYTIHVAYLTLAFIARLNLVESNRDVSSLTVAPLNSVRHSDALRVRLLDLEKASKRLFVLSLLSFLLASEPPQANSFAKVAVFHDQPRVQTMNDELAVCFDIPPDQPRTALNATRGKSEDPEGAANCNNPQYLLNTVYESLLFLDRPGAARWTERGVNAPSWLMNFLSWTVQRPRVEKFLEEHDRPNLANYIRVGAEVKKVDAETREAQLFIHALVQEGFDNEIENAKENVEIQMRKVQEDPNQAFEDVKQFVEDQWTALLPGYISDDTPEEVKQPMLCRRALCGVRGMTCSCLRRVGSAIKPIGRVFGRKTTSGGGQ